MSTDLAIAEEPTQLSTADEPLKGELMGPLSPGEREELDHHERRIGNNFREMGESLTAIKDRKLYRETHTTFRDYVGDRWGISRPRAYQLIVAVEVAADLAVSTNVDTGPAMPTPTSEGPLRVLGPLDSDERREAWARASEAAGGDVPTVAQVTDAAHEVAPEKVKARKPTKAERAASPAAEGRACGAIPDGVEAEVIDSDPAAPREAEPPAEKAEPTIEERLAELPIRAKLSAYRLKIFDAEATAFYRCTKARLAFRNATAAFRNQAKKDAGHRIGPWVAKAEWFLSRKDPCDWLLCGTCGGTGSSPVGDCPTCDKNGFMI